MQLSSDGWKYELVYHWVRGASWCYLEDPGNHRRGCTLKHWSGCELGEFQARFFVHATLCCVVRTLDGHVLFWDSEYGPVHVIDAEVNGSFSVGREADQDELDWFHRSKVMTRIESP